MELWLQESIDTWSPIQLVELYRTYVLLRNMAGLLY